MKIYKHKNKKLCEIQAAIEVVQPRLNFVVRSGILVQEMINILNYKGEDAKYFCGGNTTCLERESKGSA